MSSRELAPRWGGGVAEEVRKLPAFFRRDLLVMWSYRLAFVVDWVGMLGQVLLFALIGRLVSPANLPSFGGRPTSYVEFVMVGITLSSFLQITLSRLPGAIREAQLAGTLESVLVTPTAATTWQLGSVIYDLAYVPIRTALFLVIVSGAFGVDMHASGLGPAGVALLAFIPFAWGLGMVSAAGVLTFRRGGGAVGVLVYALILGSTAYFPAAVMPAWIAPIVELNPLTVTLDAMREALLGGGGFGTAWSAAITVLPFSACSTVLGMAAFGLALDRERHRGTLGIY